MRTRWVRIATLVFVVPVLVVIPGIAFRLQAFLFQRQVSRLMAGLSSLRIGETSKAEALARVPGLSDKDQEDEKQPCAAEECLSITIPPVRLFQHVLTWSAFEGRRGFYGLLQWWGVRYWIANVHVNVTSGKVSGFVTG